MHKAIQLFAAVTGLLLLTAASADGYLTADQVRHALVGNTTSGVYAANGHIFKKTYYVNGNLLSGDRPGHWHVTTDGQMCEELEGKEACFYVSYDSADDLYIGTTNDQKVSTFSVY